MSQKTVSPERVASGQAKFDVLELFRPQTADRKEEAPRPVMSLRNFHRLLKTEIRWADRTRSSLTFLIFDMAAQNGEGPLREDGLTCLASVIPKCTRRTDMVGWFHDRGTRRLGLILHNTVPERARCVIANLQARFQTEMRQKAPLETRLPELTCDIYSYPWRSEPGGNNPRQLSLFDEGPEKRNNLPGVKISKNGEIFHGTRIGRYPGMDSIRPAGSIMGHPHPKWKRAIDFFGSLFILVLLSPLLLAVTLAVKLTSKGPVLFSQDRVGHGGRIYTCLKFRSMKQNYDTTAHKNYLKTLIKSASSTEGDGIPMKKLDSVNSQITTVGRLIRKSSIDELPQLINVLRGEMSLVGPRPCVPYEAVEFLCWHTRRFDTVPGMTGLWQVKGKNRTTFKEMIRLDIRYGLHQSLLFDLKIFLMTLPAVLRDFRAA
jgi:lipopolysaccharide/colanic/teichoic acid biosynthesis glycosyltransferase